MSSMIRTGDTTMKTKANGQREANLIKGDFFTDGETFVFRLAGTPISGVGNSAATAFEDLVRVSGETAPLADRLRELARDQQDETVRATVIKFAMVGLILFGVVGGALFGAAAMLPRVVADTSETTVTEVARWIENMPAEKQEGLARAMARIWALSGQSRGAASPSSDPNR
jgi:hypothetical protein